MNKEKLKQDVINKFDFDTAKTIMDVMNWKWVLNDGYGVPSVEEIRQMVSELIDELFNAKDCSWISSGGFKVELTKEETGYDTIIVTFEALRSFSFCEQ